MYCRKAIHISEVNMDKEELIIKVPRGDMTGTQVDSLKLIVYKKADLLKEAFAAKSIVINEEDGSLSFPWFTLTGDDNEAMVFMRFVSRLIALAKRTKRVDKDDGKKVVNDSYAFRCFLLRLGYIGDDFKQDRKILMRSFSKGSSAFRQKKEASDADTQQERG
jgi:hypothetical protein